MSLSEDEKVERITNHPQDDDECQVVEVEEVETLNGECNDSWSNRLAIIIHI